MVPSAKYHGPHCKRLQSFFCVLLSISLLFVLSCGKKGAPTLLSYEKAEAPSLLSAFQRENRIVLSWRYPADKERAISDFIVLRSSADGFEKIATIENKSRTFVDADVREGMTYTYKVVCRSPKGVLSSDSNHVSVPVVAPPPPPERISWSISGDSLLLSWEKTGKDIMYNVYKSAQAGAYGMTAENKSPLPENVFKDAFSPAVTVYYTIRSLPGNGTAEGPASQEIVLNPHDLIPSAPQDVRYFAAPEKIYLYWKEPDVSWITGFRIYRRFEAGKYELIAETQIPSFLDKENPSRKRDYRITAVGPAKEGPAAEIRGVIFIAE